MMIKQLFRVALITWLCSNASVAQETATGGKDSPPLALDSIELLIGDWWLVTTYANGAIGKGDRKCALDLGGVYIKCETTIVFEHNDRPRRSVDYINANPRRNVFENVTMWEFPASKKLIDVSPPNEEGYIHARGFLYTGDGAFSRRISETWNLSQNEVTMTLRMNRLDQRAEEFPVFLEDNMTRKP